MTRILPPGERSHGRRRHWSGPLLALTGLALFAAASGACSDTASSSDDQVAITTGDPLDVVLAAVAPGPGPAQRDALTITSLTSPVLLNHSAKLVAKTVPGETCHLRYTTPAGVDSSVDGLGNAKASYEGVVSWTWRIRGGTPAGTGLVHVTCGSETLAARIVIP